jgi:hypothetical protein
MMSYQLTTPLSRGKSIYVDVGGVLLKHLVAVPAFFLPQNIDVICMPKPGDFVYQDKQVKCYVTGWGRRTESESAFFYSVEHVFHRLLSLPDT